MSQRPHDWKPVYRPSCDDTYTLPIADAVVTGLLVYSAHSWLEETEGDAVIIEPLLALGAGIISVFTGLSALSGLSYRSTCSAALTQHRRYLATRGSQSTSPSTTLSRRQTPERDRARATEPPVQLPPSRRRNAFDPPPRLSLGAGTGFPDLAHVQLSVWPSSWLSFDGRASTIFFAHFLSAGATLHLGEHTGGAYRRALLLHGAVGAGITSGEDRRVSRIWSVAVGVAWLGPLRDTRLLVGALRDGIRSHATITLTFGARIPEAAPHKAPKTGAR